MKRAYQMKNLMFDISLTNILLKLRIGIMNVPVQIILTWSLENVGHFKVFRKGGRTEGQGEKGGHVLQKEDVW